MEEFFLYFESKESLDVIRYNMMCLEKKFENIENDAKDNNWDSAVSIFWSFLYIITFH